jgi:hypothetical protein
MTIPSISGVRCRCCGVDASRAGAAVVDRIPFEADLGPAELLLHFCEPCVAGFGDEDARRAYVRGLLAA